MTDVKERPPSAHPSRNNSDARRTRPRLVPLGPGKGSVLQRRASTLETLGGGDGNSLAGGLTTLFAFKQNKGFRFPQTDDATRCHRKQGQADIVPKRLGKGRPRPPPSTNPNFGDATVGAQNATVPSTTASTASLRKRAHARPLQERQRARREGAASPNEMRLLLESWNNTDLLPRARPRKLAGAPGVFSRRVA